MTANQADFPISTMSAVLGVSRSGFYARRNRPRSARARTDVDLTERIAAFHKRSHGTYGALRIHADLAEAGVSVGRKRVERLMRAAGIAGVSRRRFARTTIRDDRVRPAADLVDRDFTAEKPDRLWVADITYIATWTGFFHLAPRHWA
jgi:putative transposase